MSHAPLERQHLMRMVQHSRVSAKASHKGMARCRQKAELAWAAAGAHLQRGGGVVRARAARAADQGGALPDQPAVLAHVAAPAARVRPVRPLLLPAALWLCAVLRHQWCLHSQWHWSQHSCSPLAGPACCLALVEAPNDCVQVCRFAPNSGAGLSLVLAVGTVLHNSAC